MTETAGIYNVTPADPAPDNEPEPAEELGYEEILEREDG
jgi:hypothetical protein